MHALIATLFHPGDLSLGEWAGLLGIFAAFVVLPIVIIGFIIFKVVNKHSGSGVAGESRESITLDLNGPTRK